MAQCNVMFCIQDPHADDLHVDPTGYTWSEATPAEPVIAHVIYAQDASSAAAI